MDQQLLFLVNRTWTSPSMDTFMAVVTDSGFWAPALILAGILLAVFGGFRGRAFLVVMGLVIGVVDGLVVGSLKEAVGRPRPHEVLGGVRTVGLAKASPKFLALGKPLEIGESVAGIHPPSGRSFPSGHAANNFAVATVVALFYRRRGWLMFLPAALVAYSRVYIGSHWPLDVVVSALLGAGVALLVVAACEWLWRTFSWWLPARFTGARRSLFVR
jgi:undecaprenyl-diphosphatase